MIQINREVNSKYDVNFFVPCLNEQGNIGPTLKNIINVCKEFSFTFEILVFDDHSSDGTVAEARQVAIENPTVAIRIFQNESRHGLARNYCDGAYEGQAKYYMLVNGDNAEPPEALREILSHLGEADMIIPVFKDSDNRTTGRRWLSIAFTSLVNWISGNSITYYNGPVLHRRFNVMRWHADTDGFAYQAEIITRLLQEGASYKEVVISNSDRVLGSSSALTKKNFLAITHSLSQILIRRIRYHMFYNNTPKGQSVPARKKSANDVSQHAHQ